MQTLDTNSPLSAVFKSIEIPDSAYEKSEARYDDLGKWLCRSESAVREYDPEVFPQGSFLLGTVTRPTSDDADYDLDLGVKLRRRVSKTSHTQEQLKIMVGDELERYRQARGIHDELDEKRRCWRLRYQDEMSFHLDIVPCIPEDEHQRGAIQDAMLAADTAPKLAEEVARLTVSITDNERSDYGAICLDWNVSNPQGYGRWFAARVRLAERAALTTDKRAEVQQLPSHRLKGPLQRCVQILKLHRDVMFSDDRDRAPISIIITTLAARAYSGQNDVEEALFHILNTMGNFVGRQTPRVPNPVNPNEDFADKWATDEGLALGLEENFWRWLIQAQADSEHIASIRDAGELEDFAKKTLGASVDSSPLRKSREASLAANAATVGYNDSGTAPSKTRILTPPKPWATK